MQIFVLNTHESVNYFDIRLHTKLVGLLNLTDDFFNAFAKYLMEGLKNVIKPSEYLIYDTLTRLRFAKIILN